MGPLQLCDEIGLDVCGMILKALEPKLGERFATPPVLTAAVRSNCLGRKLGCGFYVYDGKSAAPNLELTQGSKVALPDEICGRTLERMSDEARDCCPRVSSIRPM